MATRMQQRRGTAATWTAADPILAAGEIGFEIDTNKFKIGDGSNRWAQLTYFTADAAAAIQDLIDGAPGVLDTLNELAAAVNDDPNFFSTVATNLSNHEADTTNVHGIANTANLVTLAGTQTLTNKTLTSPIINTPTGITKSDVGLSNVDNTSDANKPVSTATQSALDLKAPLASPTFTGTVSGVTKSMVGLGNVDNTSDANKPVSTATQSALDLKADLDGATFSGAVSITDATAATNAITGAVTIAGGLGVLGASYFGNDLVVEGSLTVNGTTTTVGTQDLVVQDPMIYLGEGNSTNVVDLGIVASFDDGTYQHTGLVRDASAGTWKLFKGVTDEPSGTINFSQGSLDDLSVAGLNATSITVGDVSNTEIGYLNGVTSAIQTQIDGKISATSLDSLENKTIDLADNTVTGTIAEFNAALSDADFATLSGTETLTNKSIDLASNTLSGTIAQFNTAVSDANLATVAGAETLTNKTIAFTDNTITVSVANVTDLTASASELNLLDGVTASTAELNILDGLTASTTELNYVDGVTSAIQTQLDDKSTASKTETLSNKTISYTNNTITVQASNISDVTASAAELNILDGVTAGTSELNVLDGITATTSELNYVSGVTSALQTQIDAKAPLASPALTGVPTAPTASLGTNSTQVATTAFVDAAIEALASRSLILDGGGV